MIRIVVAVAIELTAAAADAKTGIEKLNQLNGIVDILLNADHCGLDISSARLSKYYARSGMDNVEDLGYIAAALGHLDAAKIERNKPTPLACTLLQTTAQSLDLLNPTD